MTRLGEDVARSAMAGASTGGRTFTALAAQALTARADAPGRPDATLTTPWVRGVIGLLAVGELIGDKLPQTPSRLGFPGLSGRLAVSAACGVIIARREPDPLSGQLDDSTTDPTVLGDDAADTRTRTIACALAGVVVAAASSWCGTKWRAAASSRTGRDWIGAGLEDVAVLGLAAAAARAR